MLNQTQTLNQILYRTEKSALSNIDKAFSGVVMEPKLTEANRYKKEKVAELEKQKGIL